MPKEPIYSVRLSDLDVQKIVELGQRWGPVRPLNPSEVIRESIARAHRAEARKRNREKSPEGP